MFKIKLCLSPMFVQFICNCKHFECWTWASVVEADWYKRNFYFCASDTGAPTNWVVFYWMKPKIRMSGILLSETKNKNGLRTILSHAHALTMSLNRFIQVMASSLYKYLVFQNTILWVIFLSHYNYLLQSFFW